MTELFSQIQIIHCLCPNCSRISRVSDLRISAETEKTWRDTYDEQVAEIEAAENVFADQEDMIRQAARERGRRTVPGIVQQCVREEFARLGYDPYDIKAVLHPMDFVIFNGMNSGNLKNIILSSGRTDNTHLQEIRKKVEQAVIDRSYDWKVLRFLRDGGVKYE